MSNRLPLPRPGPLGLIQYAGVDMHAYADAENAALRARVKVLEGALRNLLFIGEAPELTLEAYAAASEAARAALAPQEEKK